MTTLTDKYKVTSLDGIVGHQEDVKLWRKWNTNNSLPHLIYYGTWGTGKTSIVIAGLRDYYGKYFNANVLFRNASSKSDRSIASIDADIDSMSIIAKGGFPYRVIVYDEAEQMLPASQKALKEATSRHGHNCKIIMMTNDETLDKIDGGFKNGQRCLQRLFVDPTPDEVRPWLVSIAEEEAPEDFDYESVIDNILIMTSNPRKSLNKMELLFNGGTDIEFDMAEMARNITKKLFNNFKEKVKYKTLYREVYGMYQNIRKAVPNRERIILKYMFTEVEEHLDDQPNVVGEMSKIFAKVDDQLNNSVNPHIHMAYCLSVLSRAFTKWLE